MDTPPSLLHRLRQPGDQEAWGRFVELYTPLLFRWAERLGFQESDAADLVQDLFIQLFRKLPEFEYDPARSFRGWLHRVAFNLWRDRLVKHLPVTGAHGRLAELPAAEGSSRFEDAEYQQILIHRALDLLQDQFPADMLAAFRAYAMEGSPVEQVAEKMKISVNAVYLAKSRIIRRLRQELSGLLD